jgi:hypothetical protein
MTPEISMIKYFDLSGSVYQLRGKIRRAIALFLGTVYYFVFLACYYLIISPLYSYAGITFWHLDRKSTRLNSSH